jgi:hypothetical protein
VLGSIVIGVLIDVSAGGLVAFCVVAELAAIPLVLVVRSKTLTGRAAGQGGSDAAVDHQDGTGFHT